MKSHGPARSTTVRDLAARLAHDVGKYVARTAHNVAPAAWTADLAAMVCRDLYALDGGRASAVFETHATAIEAMIGAEPRLTRARASLADIDHLEREVRRGEPAALARAATLALAVEHDLRDLAKSLQKGAP